jgi:hypothetical protein
MNKLTYLSFACIFLGLMANPSQAQTNQPTSPSIIGAWAADSVFNVNFKTGKRKPDMDFSWFQYTFKPDMTGDEFWAAGDDGGDINFTWSYSVSDSVLKLTLDKSKPTYWKFTHITDTSIDMVSYEPNKHLNTGVERKFVNNYIILGKLVLSANSSAITYPNPVRNMVILEYKTSSETFPVTNEILSANLYDTTGKLIKTFMNHVRVYSDADTKKQLNFSTIPAGNYILTISNNQSKTESVSIVKK